MMIRISHDYDDTDDDHDNQNDSYTAVGAAPGARVPCSFVPGAFEPCALIFHRSAQGLTEAGI